MRLIDADELKKYSYRTDWNVPVVDVRGIDNAPTVEQNWRFYYDHGYKQAERDLKRPKGEWKLISMGLTYKYQCSLCGRTISTTPMFLADYPFCHCGADMRGDNND